MARPIVLSNSHLHVGINIYGEVHDFYYPYVGLENHAAAKNLRHKIGVWIDGQIRWFDDQKWQFNFSYHKHTLIGHTRAYHPELNVSLEFDDAVDSDLDVFMRNIHVINHADYEREIRVFMHQVFDISDGAGNGDTVQYLPDSDVILHYRGNRAFVIGGIHATSKQPFDQYSVGLFGIENHVGTFADAEDGVLDSNNVEHGRVDSVIGYTLHISAHSSARIHYWTKWIEPASNYSLTLKEEWRDMFVQSVLLIKAQTDAHGAVIASTDTTMLNYARDSYSYCWPRDGAYAMWPLVRLGYTKEPLAFFDFCKRIIHPKGYLMHKYQADGALGSSWHPYLHGSVASPPIQEDETAIVLFLLVQYWQMHKDEDVLEQYYKSLISPMADFLVGFIDEESGLPKPSYDLWEERFFVPTYTVSVVYAALLAAAEVAERNTDPKNAVRWRTAANDIGEIARKKLFDENRGVLLKGLVKNDSGELVPDRTIDVSAVYGAFMFGLFAPDSAEIAQSIAAVRSALSMPNSPFPGIARYENDYYRRVSGDIPGNPWFITTLWLAQYALEMGSIDEATAIVEWCKQHMLPTGVLSEQVNPYTDAFVSVAPLTWSQAEIVSTLLDFTTNPITKH